MVVGRFIFLSIVMLLASVGSAQVSVGVYLPDGETLLGPADPNLIHAYRDIMVGTRLVLVVNSDEGGYWAGGLLLTWDNWIVGNLSARGEDSGSPDYSYGESILEAAGEPAYVTEYFDGLMVGFDLLTHYGAIPGKWFVLDYHAAEVGLCYVGLYDYNLSFDIPVETLLFNQVPSRDFDGDTAVDFMDFALLASHWGQQSPSDPGLEAAFDQDGDGAIGMTDLALFSEFWLQRTDCNEPAIDPNTPTL